MATSWYYIARDLAQLAAGVAAAYVLLSFVENPALRAAIWVAYWFVQGTTCFGLWVIAHECGHQAYFGNRKQLNNAVGYFFHTLLLAPYHAWRISHGTHHRYTNNRAKDTAFPPRYNPSYYWEFTQYFPPLAIVNILLYLLFGWPGYIFLNFEGQPFPQNWSANHIDPNSPYFQPSDREDIIVSDIGFFGVIGALLVWAQLYGFSHMMCWYGGCIVVNYMWLVLVTFLQHSDPEVPHYEHEEWDFVKGAIATVDRDYGIFNNWLHHITNGHVVHHLFSTMPFYNAIQATPHVAKLMGKYYVHDERPMYKQLWYSWFAHQASFLTNPRYQVWLQKRNKKSSSR